MSVDQICFDFLIGRLKNNLESEGVKKKNFIDWLYAATIDKAVETEKFELLNKPEIFNSFTADERLKTLFYIATYTDIKFPSPIDIPDALERIANKLLRYIPRGQVDFVTDKLKEYPNQISLNDKSVKLIYFGSLLNGLNEGIDDNNVPGKLYIRSDNYEEFMEIMKDLIMKRSDVQTKFQEYRLKEYDKIIYWKLKDSTKYLGLIEVKTSSFEKFITLHRNTKVVEKNSNAGSASSALSGGPDSKETIVDSPISDLALDPYDFISIMSSEFKDKPSEVEAVLVPALLVHHMTTKNATAKVAYRVHFTLAALATFGAAAELGAMAAAVDEVYAYQWFFQSLAFANGVGNMEVASLKLDGKDIPPVLDNFVTLSDIYLISSFGMVKNIGNYKAGTKGVVLSKGAYSAFRNYVKQTELMAIRVKQVILESKALQTIKDKALLTYERLIKLKDYAKLYLFRMQTVESSFLSRLSSEYPNLHKYFFDHIPPAQYEEFIAAFQNAPDNVLSLLNKDASLLDEWNALAKAEERAAFVETININSKNIAWNDWVSKGRKIVPELIPSTLEHTYHGQIRIKFKDNGITPDFVATPENIWAELQNKFMSDDVFAEALLKTDNLGKQTFSGLHSFDEIKKLNNTVLPNGEKLLNYSSKTPIVTLPNGKIAYEVVDPLVLIPDLSNLKSINKGKSLSNRVWTNQGQTIKKGEGISSCYFEGMSKDAVAKMISESFVLKINKLGNKWESNMNYLNTAFKTEMRINDNIISTSYIIK